ncbi:unannotated protein [freshwater metagenome]|uniref:Unannotated protein n=1 Tax=freshwater metagenome TaxID=449393 RepID=A0A6J6E7Z8_9ZZZZ
MPHVARRRSRCFGLLAMAGGTGARGCRTPCRIAAGVQRGCGGAFPTQARQGCFCHGNTRAGHKHARPLSRARKARQVQRRGEGALDTGGVHTTHRASGSTRNRCRGSRRHPVVRGARSPDRCESSESSHLPAQLKFSSDVQHGCKPHYTIRSRSHARDSRVFICSIPGGPCGGRPGTQGSAAGRFVVGHGKADVVSPRGLRPICTNSARSHSTGEVR